MCKCRPKDPGKPFSCAVSAAAPLLLLHSCHPPDNSPDHGGNQDHADDIQVLGGTRYHLPIVRDGVVAPSHLDALPLIVHASTVWRTESDVLCYSPRRLRQWVLQKTVCVTVVDGNVVVLTASCGSGTDV